MPIDIPTQVEFIRRLQREGRISLDAVYNIFYKTPKSRNPQTLLTILLGHYRDGATGELVVLDRESGESVSPLNEAVLSSPDRYDVAYNGCAGTETSALEQFAGRLMLEEGDDGRTEAYVVAQDPVSIHGDPAVALPQIRRLQAFTNHVGNLLVQRRFAELSALLWDRETEAHSAQALAATLAGLERKYGRFELFCDPRVYSIYAGDGRSHKHFDEMKLPKGLTRDQRVGISGFDLASSITPNGVPRWVLSAYLETVAVDSGEFRITCLDWRYTY